MVNKNENNSKKWQIFDRIPQYRQIVQSLTNIPQEWSLTPIRGKSPYREQWQTEPPLERSRLAQVIEHGEELKSKKTGNPYTAYASGYGLRTGNGLLAIDIDGHSARKILEVIVGEIPQTVSWTSGKSGRSQILFSIPSDIHFTRYVVKEYQELKADKGEALEFRYERCSSALPPSYHPETGAYHWLNSPKNVPVAIAPDKIILFLLFLAQQQKEEEEIRAKRLVEIKRIRLERAKKEIEGKINFVDILEESCDRLGTDIYDWEGHNFHETAHSLQGCCPNHDSHSGRSFHVNKEDLSWFCFGCNVGGGAVQYKEFVANGKTKVDGVRFVEIVRELADQANVVIPEQRDGICSLTESIPHAQKQKALPLAETELFKSNRFVIWLNAIAQGLGKKAYKGFGQNCLDINRKEVLNSSKIHYSPGAPIDWEYCIANNIKIIYQNKDRAKLWAEIRGSRYEVVGSRYSLFDLIFKSIKFQSEPNLLLTTYYLLLKESKAFFALDTSATGTGKSHTSGLFKTEKGKIWVLSREHRNPTTATLEQNKFDIPTRNIGIKHDITRVTPNEQPYRHNITPGEIPNEPANCHNAHLFHLAAAKGYSFDEGEINPLCANCIFGQWKIEDENGNKTSKCAGDRGEGFGYKYLRRLALSHPELRGHIDSLPAVADYDYSNDIAIVDEASTLIRHSKTITATLADLDKWLLDIRELDKNLFEAIYPFLAKLRKLLDSKYEFQGRDKKYGLDHDQVLKILGKIPVEVDDLIERLTQLVKTFNVVVPPDKLSGLPKEYSTLVKIAKEKTEANLQAVACNFLLPLLQTLKDSVVGTIRITPNHTLNLTVADSTHKEKLQLFNKVILLDATGDKAHLEKVLGQKILHIEQYRKPLKNLKVINVNMAGLGSGKWSKEAQNRVVAMSGYLQTQHSKLEIVSLKQYAELGIKSEVRSQKSEVAQESLGNCGSTDNENKKQILTNGHSQALHRSAFLGRGNLARVAPPLQGRERVTSDFKILTSHGYWFRDNRGTNRYKGCDAIAAFGKPCINLGTVKDQYKILYGSLENFDDYYKSLMEREILQLIGRQRSHLYPDRHFYLYICAPNLDLDFLKPLGVQMQECHAFELCAEAGTKEQFRRSQLVSVVQNLVELGEPISQKRIAQMMDVTQGYISQLCSAIAGGWQSIKKLLPLYIGSYKETNIFETQQIKDWILDNLGDYLKEWLQLIAEKGMQTFCDQVLHPQPLQVRGFIIAVLYSMVLNKRKHTRTLKRYGLYP